MNYGGGGDFRNTVKLWYSEMVWLGPLSISNYLLATSSLTSAQLSSQLQASSIPSREVPQSYIPSRLFNFFDHSIDNLSVQAIDRVSDHCPNPLLVIKLRQILDENITTFRA